MLHRVPEDDRSEGGRAPRPWAWQGARVAAAIIGVLGIIRLAQLEISGLVGVALAAIIVTYFAREHMKRFFGRA